MNGNNEIISIVSIYCTFNTQYIIIIMGAFEDCKTIDQVLNLLRSMREAGTLTLSHELVAELRLIELQSQNLPTNTLNELYENPSPSTSNQDEPVSG